METRRILSSGSLASDPIVNRQGEKIADVEELMIDVSTGRVAYVVVSYGGFLGIGDKLFAVPWSAVSVDQHNHSLVIDLDEELLAAAPGFDKDQWPDFSDPTWMREVNDHYGVEHDWLLT